MVEREVASDWLVQSDGPYVAALDPRSTDELRRGGAGPGGGEPGAAAAQGSGVRVHRPDRSLDRRRRSRCVEAVRGTRGVHPGRDAGPPAGARRARRRRPTSSRKSRSTGHGGDGGSATIPGRPERGRSTTPGMGNEQEATDAPREATPGRARARDEGAGLLRRVLQRRRCSRPTATCRPTRSTWPTRAPTPWSGRSSSSSPRRKAATSGT